MDNENLTAALKEAYASAPQDDVTFLTLELYHSTFVDEDGEIAPIRVVNDYKDLEATLEAGALANAGETVTFTRFAFRVKLPSVSEGAHKELVVEMDNVTPLLVENIDRSKTTTEKIILTYRPYLLSDLSGPQIDPPYRFIMRTVDITQSVVTGKATFSVELTNKSFPNKTYSIKNFPGLVR